MARLIGPDEAVRVVYLAAGTDKGKASAQGAPAVIYADQALTTPADIRSLTGAVVPEATVIVDAYSKLPLFQFPDGSDTVYTSINGGPSVTLYARTDDRLDALSLAAAAAAPLQYPRSLSAGITLAKPYESFRNGYNLGPASTQRFRAAVARALSGGPSARIVCVGDSITFGIGASDSTKRWASALNAMITAKLGTAVCGTGAISLFDVNYGAPWDSRIAYTGGVGNETYDSDPAPGIMGGSVYLPSGATMTFTPGRSDIDQLIVCYYRNAATATNSLTVKVDGAAVGTIDCHLAGTPYGIGRATFNVTPGVAHVFGFTATANYGLLMAVEGRVNGGNGGCSVSAFGNPSHDVQHLINPGYAAADFAPCIAQQSPDLTIIMLQTNEYTGALRGGAQMTIANYKSAWQTAINAAKAAGGDVMIATEWPTSEIHTVPYGSYTAALYQLADTNDLPLVDNVGSVGTFAENQALGLNSDAYHPNGSGHRLIASNVYGALRSVSAGL